nr:hypothetical protein [uncultured Flavobacterium sp.]
MPQTIIELTTLIPSPDNYILYHHIIEDKDYFSLKSKSNEGTHFTFKKLEEISINNEVFINAEELINAFNETFNTAEFIPENSSNKQENLNPDSTGKKFPNITAVNQGLALKVDKVTGKSLIDDAEITKLSHLTDAEITKLSHLDDTPDTLKPLSTAAINALALKLTAGGYTGTAEDLRLLIISSTTGFSGTSVKPTDTPTGTGVASWIALQAGTYTNFGGVIVNANSIAIISRTALGAFSISQTALDLTEYKKITDNVKIEAWTAKTFLSGDQVNHLGKDWVSNATTLSTDIPGTSNKWVDRLGGYANKTDVFATYSADTASNSFLKELYLVNNNNIPVYLSQARRNYTGTFQYLITLVNSVGAGVATFNVNSIIESTTSVLELLEVNSSGVSGYCVVDWNTITTNSIKYFNDKLLNADAYNISKAYHIKNKLNKDFNTAKADIIVNKNDITTIKADVVTVKADILTVKNDMSTVQQLVPYFVKSKNADNWTTKTKLFSNGAIFSGSLGGGSQDIYIIPVVANQEYKLSKNVNGASVNIAIATLAFSSNNNALGSGSSFGIIGSRIFGFDTTFITPTGCNYVYIALVAGTDLSLASLQKITVSNPTSSYPIEGDKLIGVKFSVSPSRNPLCTWIDDDTNLNGMSNVKTICDAIGIKATFAIIPDYDSTKLATLLTYQQAGFHFTIHPTHQGWYSGPTTTFTSVADCEDKLITGIKLIKKDGFLNSDYLVYPGSSNSNAGIVKMMKKWCPAGISAGFDGYNTSYGLGRYLIKREFIDFTTKTMADYKLIVDNAYINKAWLIFGTHSNDFTLNSAVVAGSNTTGNLQELMTYAYTKGMSFNTFHEAFETERKFIYNAKDMGFLLDV